MEARERHPLYAAALAADDAWSKELTRRFGRRAGDVRYTAEGKGEPGTPLRAAHDAWEAARDAWRAAGFPLIDGRPGAAAPDKTYAGTSPGDTWAVLVREGGVARPLPPRHDLRNHSPCGFAWGYGGSGPAQLALAILADAAGEAAAERHYQAFKWAVIARLRQDAGFTMSAAAVLAWLVAREAEA